MALIPLYQTIRSALLGAPSDSDCRRWDWVEPALYRPNRRFFDGLQETYGAEAFGPGGVPGALTQAAPLLREALRLAPAYGLEESSARLLEAVTPLLPGEPPDLWLSTLLFMAPAGTIAIDGRPAIVLGLERFHPNPPTQGEKVWYRPGEVEEMIPHEAAHAARMQVLGLPPTPRRLSLLEMVMLEGTALTFTDQLLGRMTLATFMPRPMLDWHRQNDRYARSVASADFGQVGMPVFQKYFSPTGRVSGYYVGYSLCREYLDRYGDRAVTELIALPSAEILRRLGPG